MGIYQLLPAVVYDNNCYLCSRFAEILKFISMKKITFIGHHTELGQSLRKRILDESALEMFWFIRKDMAFGGRSALIPLLIHIISFKNTKTQLNVEYDHCNEKCKNVQSVFIRTASLLTHSKKIKIVFKNDE